MTALPRSRCASATLWFRCRRARIGGARARTQVAPSGSVLALRVPVRCRQPVQNEASRGVLIAVVSSARPRGLRLVLLPHGSACGTAPAGDTAHPHADLQRGEAVHAGGILGINATLVVLQRGRIADGDAPAVGINVTQPALIGARQKCHTGSMTGVHAAHITRQWPRRRAQ